MSTHNIPTELVALVAMSNAANSQPSAIPTASTTVRQAPQLLPSYPITAADLRHFL